MTPSERKVVRGVGRVLLGSPGHRHETEEKRAGVQWCLDKIVDLLEGRIELPQGKVSRPRRGRPPLVETSIDLDEVARAEA